MGAPPGRVLRIAILQDRTITAERLIKPGETVTVGQSATNTFVLPKTHLPGGFPLFVARGGAIQLHVTEAMTGRIRADGKTIRLGSLRADPAVVKQGGTWRIPLGDQHQGKLDIDGVTVLFQFVPAQALAGVGGRVRMDFRAKLVDDEDPALFGFLGLFGMVGVLFLVIVALAPSVEPPPPDWTGETWRPVAQLRPDKPEPPPEPEPVEGEAPSEVARPAVVAPRPEPPRDRASRALALRRRASVLVLGSRGRSPTSTGSAYEAQVLAHLDKVRASEVVTEGEAGPRSREGAEGEEHQLESLGTSDEVGTSHLGGATVTLKPSTEAEDGDVTDATGDTRGLRAVVLANASRLNVCYEDQLRADPDLEGRVAVQFVVDEGVVRRATIAFNGTGNAALGTCIARRIERWRFDTSVSGPVSWPFVFRKK